MNTTQQIDVLIEKARKLATANQQLLQNNSRLEIEVKRLQDLLQTESVKTGDLANKIKIIKLAQNIAQTDSENADVSELKRKINEYIKEIDYCIKMLND